MSTSDKKRKGQRKCTLNPENKRNKKLNNVIYRDFSGYLRFWRCFFLLKNDAVFLLTVSVISGKVSRMKFIVKKKVLLTANYQHITAKK